MRRPGRKLSAEEAALWAKVAQTVAPMAGRDVPRGVADDDTQAAPPGTVPSRKPPPPSPLRAAAAAPHPREDHRHRALDRLGLDATWDRKLSRGIVAPDFTLDLHGATLDAAHGRLEQGLTLALAQGARVVLLVTGRDRPSENRQGRGVIRRKFMDWLAAGPHASRIAAIRPAHPRHGGHGAVYIVLKRPR